MSDDALAHRVRELEEELRHSRENLQAVSQTAPDAIFTFDGRGDIEFANRAGGAMFGYSPARMGGMSIHLLVRREADGEPVAWGDLASVPNESVSRTEVVTATRGDASTFPAYASAGAFTRGGQRRYTAIIHDITDRREARAAARESEAHFRLMTDALPALIAYLDTDKRFRFLNKTYDRWYGRAAASFIGQPLVARFGPEDAKRIDRRLDRVLAEGQSDADATRLRLPEHGDREVHAVFVPHLGADGRPVGLYALMTDITELKRAERALLASNRELEDKNREMEQFIHTISHDLKSPLVTLSGLLGYLREEAEGGRVRRAAKLTATLEQTARGMRETLDDLLEFSRIGRTGLRHEAVDLRALIDRSINRAWEDIQRCGARVEVTLPEDFPPVDGDRKRLGQVLDNLLSNAILHGCDDEATRVWIGGEVEEGRPGVFVRDFGQGIDPDHHQRVFGLFRRLDHRAPGSGVGLTVARRIMETMGGRIEVQSSPGEGATFWLEFTPAPSADAAGREDG